MCVCVCYYLYSGMKYMRISLRKFELCKIFSNHITIN